MQFVIRRSWVRFLLPAPVKSRGCSDAAPFLFLAGYHRASSALAHRVFGVAHVDRAVTVFADAPTTSDRSDETDTLRGVVARRACCNAADFCVKHDPCHRRASQCGQARPRFLLVLPLGMLRRSASTPPAASCAATTHAPGADQREPCRTRAAASGRPASRHGKPRLECRACRHRGAGSRSHPPAAGPVPPTQREFRLAALGFSLRPHRTGHSRRSRPGRCIGMSQGFGGHGGLPSVIGGLYRELSI